jgi:hypothetical protein
MKKKFLMWGICSVLGISIVLSTGKWIKAFTEKDVIEEVNMENEKQGVLSKYDYKVHITDQEEIKEIVSDYGIDDANGIEEIIYVPIDEDAFNTGKSICES